MIRKMTCELSRPKKSNSLIDIRVDIRSVLRQISMILRVSIFFSMFAVAGAGAADMVPVPAKKAYCKNFDSYCYEWFFKRDRSLRFVAHGDEDGGVWLFYRKLSSGKYRELFAVYPAMIDDSRPGEKFWGYAWDIQDIVLTPNKSNIMLQGSFEHNYVYDAEWKPPIGQRAVPFILFKGTATQPDIKVTEAITLRPMKPATVYRRSRVSLPLPVNAARP